MPRWRLVVILVALAVGPLAASDGGSWLRWRPVVPRVVVEQPRPVPRPTPPAAVVIETEELVYTGEPISMSLKDADVLDVLKTFSTLTGLNIVVDPSVAGTVTIELHEVPWDQAFDLILRINGLGWELENNVVYVAPMDRLVQRWRGHRSW